MENGKFIEVAGLVQEIDDTVAKLQPLIQNNEQLRVFKPTYWRVGGNLPPSDTYNPPLFHRDVGIAVSQD